MGDTANQIRCNTNPLTRVRDEVKKLEYCLEGSWETYTTPICNLEIINTLSLSQNLIHLKHVEN